MRWAVSFVLVIGCGPLVAVDGDSTDDGASKGDDDRGDDRPGTGPSPTGTVTSPTTLDDDGDDDGFPEGEVDDGWHPDFPPDAHCSEASVADCYEAFTLDGYDSEVLVVALHDLGSDGLPELVVLGQAWRAIHPGVVGGWGGAVHDVHGLETPSAIAFGDVVDDANIDLVAVQPQYQALFVETGAGRNQFYNASYVETPGLPTQLHVADIDADGFDEAIAILGDGPLVIAHDFDAMSPDLEIVASPVFETQALALGAVGSGTAVDRMLVAGVSVDQILLGIASYEDAVAGQWVVQPFVPESVGLTVRDFDGDDTLDIATASSQEPSAFLYRYPWDGSLQLTSSIDVGVPTQAAAAGRIGPSATSLVLISDGVLVVAEFVTGATIVLEGPKVQGPLAVQDSNGDGMDDIVARSADGLGVVAYVSHE